MALIELSLTLVGIGIAYFTYQDQKRKNRKDEEYKNKEGKERRDYVVQKWQFLKDMNKDLSTRVKIYIDKHNAFDMPTYDGFTLGTGLEKLELVKREILDEQFLESFQTLDRHSKISVDNLTKQLEVQIAEHAQDLTFIELLERKDI